MLNCHPLESTDSAFATPREVSLTFLPPSHPPQLVLSNEAQEQNSDWSRNVEPLAQLLDGLGEDELRTSVVNIPDFALHPPPPPPL
jgi:hypothetical protein